MQLSGPDWPPVPRVKLEDSRAIAWALITRDVAARARRSSEQRAAIMRV